MDPGVIASLPVGLVIFLGLALLAVGAAGGWLGARARLRRKSVQRAQEHLSRLTTLLSALPQAALIADREAHVTTQNPLAMQLLSELKWSDNLPLMVDAAIGRVVRTGTTETMEVAPPGRLEGRIQVTVAPLRAAGPGVEALVLFTDLRARSQLAEVNQRLLSTIAHELRTPLTAIMGHVEILNSCSIDEEALWRRSLGFVSGETERLARLVEDLLSLSRLDRIPLQLQPINLRVAAEEAISALFETAERNNVVPVIQGPTDLPRVLADQDRIRQVFLNLLDNAIKYAPGSLVTVRLAGEAERVLVEVSDNGPGIPAGDLANIFEPCQRGERAPSGSAGAGLGLTIVRAILEQHQTSIVVQSESGEGAKFSFSLPVARPA